VISAASRRQRAYAVTHIEILETIASHCHRKLARDSTRFTQF